MSPVLFTESRVTIDLTGRESFRFSTCPGYLPLSGVGLKEMDIGWFEPGAAGGTGKLYLIELKDFTIETLAGRRGYSYPTYAAKAEFIIDELVRKSIDSVCMLIAVAAGVPSATLLSPCLPPSYHPGAPIQLVHILHLSPSLEPYLTFINEQVRNKIKPYQQLFSVGPCTVLSHAQAMTIFSNIQ